MNRRPSRKTPIDFSEIHFLYTAWSLHRRPWSELWINSKPRKWTVKRICTSIVGWTTKWAHYLIEVVQMFQTYRHHWWEQTSTQLLYSIHGTWSDRARILSNRRNRTRYRAKSVKIETICITCVSVVFELLLLVKLKYLTQVLTNRWWLCKAWILARARKTFEG